MELRSDSGHHTSGMVMLSLSARSCAHTAIFARRKVRTPLHPPPSIPHPPVFRGVATPPERGGRPTAVRTLKRNSRHCPLAEIFHLLDIPHPPMFRLMFAPRLASPTRQGHLQACPIAHPHPYSPSQHTSQPKSHSPLSGNQRRIRLNTHRCNEPRPQPVPTDRPRRPFADFLGRLFRS